MKIFFKYILYSILAIITSITFLRCPLIDDIIPDEPAGVRGDTLWIHDMPGSDSLYFGNSIALGTDGSIYYSGANDGATWINARIFAVNSNDGSLKWRSEPLDHIALSSNIVIGDDGTVYAIGYYTLYAIDPATGAFKWTWECPHELFWDGADRNTYNQIGALSLTNDGDLVLGTIGAGSYYRSLFCVDKSTGQLKWYNLDANNGLNSNITIGKDGMLFYYSWIAGKSSLISVDPSSGTIKWIKEIGIHGSYNNKVVVDNDGTLICAMGEVGGERRIHRINPTTGDIISSSSFLIGSDIMFIDPNRFLYAYDWNADGSGYFKINPQLGTKEFFQWRILAIDDQNKILHVHSDYTPFVEVVNSDGSLDWTLPMSLSVGDLLISDSKVIYLASGWQIFAIQGDAKLASSGWPKRAHDNRNTNNWSKR